MSDLLNADIPAGAKAHLYFQAFAARLKSCPDTKRRLSEIPMKLQQSSLTPLHLPSWKENIEFTRDLGDAWLVSRETGLARVPSAIVPHTWNYLLNPEHPDAKQVEVAEVIQERFDGRLFGFGRG